MGLHSDHEQWGLVSRALHWLSAAVVIALFGLGLWMTGLEYNDPWYHKAPDLHRSTGLLLMLLTIARLTWLVMDGRPEALATHRPWERIVARAVHRLIYLLLAGVILSGYLVSTADGRGVSFYGLVKLPAIIYGHEGQADVAGAWHFGLAWGLMLLVVMHALAALKHHFIDQDRTLKRMCGK